MYYNFNMMTNLTFWNTIILKMIVMMKLTFYNMTTFRMIKKWNQTINESGPLP
jgi:hypothetical protein